jgi:hypothetical protein
MTSRALVPDDALRVRALDALGPLGENLAREALEAGAVLVEHDVLAWEGSHGTMHGHRVVVAVPSELRARVEAMHAAMDSLAAALAAAMSERGGHSVADVRLASAPRVAPSSGSPYRQPR